MHRPSRWSQPATGWFSFYTREHGGDYVRVLEAIKELKLTTTANKSNCIFRETRSHFLHLFQLCRHSPLSLSSSSPASRFFPRVGITWFSDAVEELFKASCRARFGRQIKSSWAIKIQGGPSALGKNYVDTKFEVAFSCKFSL